MSSPRNTRGEDKKFIGEFLVEGDQNMYGKMRLGTILLAGSMLAMVPGISSHAEGSLNGNEQAVISALSGEFTIDGEVYVADSTYLAYLQEYFSQDGVDINESQKNRAISEITGNLKRAASEGYLVKTGKQAEENSTETDTVEKTTENSDGATSQEEETTQASETGEETATEKKDKKDKKKKNEKKADKSTETVERTAEEEQALQEKYKQQIASIGEETESSEGDSQSAETETGEENTKNVFEKAREDDEEDYASAFLETEEKADAEQKGTKIRQKENVNGISDILFVGGGIAIALLAAVALAVIWRKKN